MDWVSLGFHKLWNAPGLSNRPALCFQSQCSLQLLKTALNWSRGNQRCAGLSMMEIWVRERSLGILLVAIYGVVCLEARDVVRARVSELTPGQCDGWVETISASFRKGQGELTQRKKYGRFYKDDLMAIAFKSFWGMKICDPYRSTADGDLPVI